MADRPVALITGASQGIGAAVAKQFAKRDHNCVLVARNADRLDGLARELATSGCESLVCAGDLSDLDFAKFTVDQCKDRFGRIDVLVNNAAWRKIGTMRQMDAEQWDATLRVCLTVPAFMAKWCAEVMESRGRGVILNISSIQAKIASGICPAYVAAKGGLDGLTYELGTLYGPRGIRVVGLNLGAIDTEMSADYVSDEGVNVSQTIREFAEDMIPLRRFATPQEIARTIAMLASDDASYIHATCLEIDGGWLHQASPNSLKHLQFPQEFPK